MWISSLFLISAKIATVLSVVMMAPQDTDKLNEMTLERRNSRRYRAEFKMLFNRSLGRVTEQPRPHPYYISSPITDVHKCKVNGSKSNAWKYETETVTLFAYQGTAPRLMEDRFVIDENINNTGISLYAIFDGYETEFSAEYLAYNLTETLKNKILKLKDKIKDPDLKQYLHPNGSIKYKKLLHNEIISADKNLLKKLNNTKEDRCGSTALIAIIDKTQLFIANVGDSRAVMCDAEGTAIPLTVDHHADEPDEIERIERAGGKIEIINGFYYSVDGKLGLSRCMGDIHMKRTKHVASDPEKFRYNLSELKSKFVVLASKGLWATMDREYKHEANQRVITKLDKNFRTNLLGAMISLSIFASEECIGDDNQTFMVIKTPQGERI